MPSYSGPTQFTLIQHAGDLVVGTGPHAASNLPPGLPLQALIIDPATDLPAWLYALLLQVAGVASPRRPQINLIAGGGMSISAADNPGANRTDITLAASGAAAPMVLTNPAAADVPLTIVGATAQSANLTEIYDHLGHLLTRVTPAGGVEIRGDPAQDFSRLLVSKANAGSNVPLAEFQVSNLNANVAAVEVTGGGIRLDAPGALEPIGPHSTLISTPVKPHDGTGANGWWAFTEDGKAYTRQGGVWIPASVVPAGGATGTALRKASGVDYDVAWQTVHEVPAGGAATQVLTKTTGLDYDTGWQYAPIVPGAPVNDSRLFEAGGGVSAVWVAETHEEALAHLVNAVQAGDAGDRADHFIGNALDPKWTTEGDTSKLRVTRSLLSINPGSGSVYAYQDFTPTDVLDVRLRFRVSAYCGLLLCDATAGVTGNGMFISYDVTAPGFQFWKLVAGAFTQLGVTLNPPGMSGGFGWLRLTRDHFNDWFGFVAYEDDDYLQVGNSFVYGGTIERMKIRAVNGAAATIVDLVDTR